MTVPAFRVLMAVLWEGGHYELTVQPCSAARFVVQTPPSGQVHSTWLCVAIPWLSSAYRPPRVILGNKCCLWNLAKGPQIPCWSGCIEQRWAGSRDLGVLGGPRTFCFMNPMALMPEWKQGVRGPETVRTGASEFATMGLPFLPSLRAQTGQESGAQRAR